MKKKGLSIFSFNKVALTRIWLIIEKLMLLALLCSLAGILSCGEEKGAEFKTNSPPVITSVNVLPANPHKETELNVLIQSQDPDSDPINYHYQWLKNNEEIVGSDRATLKCNDFKKDDVIQVKVTPFDGKADGKPFLSPPVKIANSQPAIQEVRIEPRVAYANDNLKVFVKGSDVDGDLIAYSYQWEKKGVILSEEKKNILETGQFKKGDWIAVTVIPDDGETSGGPKKSDPITIVNSPPIITSSPPNKTDGNIYTYQVKANDPDNNAILFGLKTAPKGMEINKETGLIRWEIHQGDRGTQLIEIEASDSEGAKSIQRYTLSIEFR